MFRKSLIIFLLSAGLKIYCQEPVSFRYADSLTYSQFVEEQWSDLIRTGHEAMRSGYDYYYLRMRIGIAYYSRRNYAQSAHHFLKALEMNENDQVALEYLYYSYLLSGKTLQAWSLISDFYPQNRDRILKESRIKRNALSIESFLSDTKTDNILSDPSSWFADPEPGSQIAARFFINNSVSASHITGGNSYYNHAFTNLVKDNYLHYSDGINSGHLFPQRVIQNQYYGALSFFSTSGWIITPSFHLVTASYPLIYFSNQGMNPIIQQYDLRSNGLFAGLSVSKSFGYLTAGLEAGYTGFNDRKKIQGTFSAVVYPAGNSRFYIGGKISAIGNQGSVDRGTGFVSGIWGGFSIAGKVWVELSGLDGDMDYYADNNGLYIYNSADVLKNKMLARLIIPFNKTGLTIFAGAGINSYSSDFIPEDREISGNNNRIIYKSNNYTGGISWNF